MPKDERDRVAAGEQSSKGSHGGNRAGRDPKEKDAKPRSDPKAGKDPGRGNR